MFDLPINGAEIDLKPILAGFQQCPKLHCSGPFVRDYFLIHYCISGTGRLWNPRGEYPVSAGKMFIICPGDKCTYLSDACDPWEYIWIGFSGNYAEKLRTLDSVVAYPYDTFFKIRELVEAEIKSPEEYLALICELFKNLFKNAKVRSDAILESKHYIDHCYMYDDISVETIAARAHIDRSYLSREFKKRFGSTVRDYIIKQRIDAAGRLLSEGYTVAETAHIVGYADAFTFSKAFKKHTGTTPSKYESSAAET